MVCHDPCVDFVAPQDWSEDDRVVLDAAAKFWATYHETASAIVAALPAHIVDELPKYVRSPQKITFTVAADGVVVTHDDHPKFLLSRGVTRQSLDDILLEATGLFEPPIGPDADLAVVEPALQVVDVDTAEVVGRAVGHNRVEVVSHCEAWRWESRWALAAARAHVFGDAYDLAAGRFVPFLSAASRALEAAADDLAALLGSSPREELLHQFLAKSPQLLSAAFLTVVSKPRLGAEHVPDFAYEEAPGRWLLVEIEPSTHALFSRKGDPTAALTHAVRQITDWRAWVNENIAYAQTVLRGVHKTTGLVVIGRASGEGAALKRYEGGLAEIRVVTWDDVVATARRLAMNLHQHAVDATSDGSRRDAGLDVDDHAGLARIARRRAATSDGRDVGTTATVGTRRARRPAVVGDTDLV